MLYWVAILEDPTDVEEENGVGQKLILGPKCVVANDDKTALVVAMQGEEINTPPERMVVQIVPFCG